MFCIRILDIQSASFSFSEPWDYVALRKAQSHQAEPRSGEATSPKNRESIIWCPREESNPYHKLRKLASYPLNDEGPTSPWIIPELRRASGTLYWHYLSVRSSDTSERRRKRRGLLFSVHLLYAPIAIFSIFCYAFAITTSYVDSS